MTRAQGAGNERGGALVACLIAAVALMAFCLAANRWSGLAAKANVKSSYSQRATYNAESGFYAALDWLRKPDSLSMIPIVGTEPSGLLPDVTYYATIVPDGSGAYTITSTGYYDVPAGAFIDPATNKPAQMGVVKAKVRVEVIADYFAVSPGTLVISNGADISDGKVAGKTLLFQTGPDMTKVQAAYFLDTVTDGTNFNISPPGVTFTAAPIYAQKLTSEVTVPQVGAMESYFKTAANKGVPCILTNGQRLTGTFTTANPQRVCYCDGNLILGSNATPLVMGGAYVFYAKGTITIEGHLQATHPTTWAALLAAGDVIIGTAAPDILTVNATVVTDHAMRADIPARNLGELTYYGGIVAHDGISLTAFQKKRTYFFRPAPAVLKLPYLVQIVSWVRGQGRHY